MDNIQNMYTYRTTAGNIYSAKSVSGINRFIARFRFAGKMMLLLGLVMLCTLAGNVWSAFSAKNVIREEIEHGLVNTVTALHGQLSTALQEDPANFMKDARHILMDARWEQDKSGYAFLIDRKGTLLIYPPSAAREGGMLDPVQVEGRTENVNQAFARIGRNDTPEKVIYRVARKTSS